MKKIFLIFIFLFGSFLTSYGSSQNIDNDQFKLYISEKPYINSYTKFEFIEKGKILVEYDKNYYEALIKAYGGKDILFWESTGEIKTEIKYDGDKIHIIFNKGDIIDKYLQYFLDNFDEYLKEENNNWWNFCNNSEITKIIGNSQVFSCGIDDNVKLPKNWTRNILTKKENYECNLANFAGAILRVVGILKLL